MGAFEDLARGGAESKFEDLAHNAPAAPAIKSKPKTREDMQKEFASRQGTPETAQRYGVTSGTNEGVPEWGRKHPNLYGLYGAAKGIGSTIVEGGTAAGGMLGGAAGGALIPVPGGAVMGGIAGGGIGYAAGKRLSSAAGLSDEPMDNSASGIGKDVVVGGLLSALPGAASLASKGIRAAGGDTAMNFLTKVPINSPRAMLAEARLPDIAKTTSALDTSFNKAVRPGVAGNRSLAQSDSYMDSARNAVKEIVLNKDSLNLTTPEGETIHDLPKNLPQFRQAIDSTKKSIWQKVEAINKSAGGTGAEVPLQSAVSELDALANKPVYKTMSPETVDYAKKRSAALAKQRSFTVDEAQDAITLANQSTKNFYQNPSADTASKAYVDSLIANHLRSTLDAALEEATGTPAAAPLRKAYGSLKAIEKDVNQRAVVDARKNTKGLVDFSDIYTAGELVHALATMNPALAAKTGTMAAVKSFIKRATDPNTHVERLFKLGDKLVSKADFPLPEVPTQPPTAPPLPPWAGKVNTGGIVQPGPVVNTVGPVNTGGISPPPPLDARHQLSPNLLAPKKGNAHRLY